jgi:hypothetical protein
MPSEAHGRRPKGSGRHEGAPGGENHFQGKPPAAPKDIRSERRRTT